MNNEDRRRWFRPHGANCRRPNYSGLCSLRATQRRQKGNPVSVTNGPRAQEPRVQELAAEKATAGRQACRQRRRWGIRGDGRNVHVSATFTATGNIL